MLHLQVDLNCEPMDFYLPSARRNTIVISADGATFEYFEVAARLIESYNPEARLPTGSRKQMSVPVVFMQSPQGDEIKEVQATAAILTPLMAAGWHQVPAPVLPTANQKEAK